MDHFTCRTLRIDIPRAFAIALCANVPRSNSLRTPSNTVVGGTSFPLTICFVLAAMCLKFLLCFLSFVSQSIEPHAVPSPHLVCNFARLQWAHWKPCSTPLGPMSNHGNFPLVFAFRYKQWLQFFRAHWHWATCFKSVSVGFHLLHKFMAWAEIFIYMQHVNI